jgi:precorrin-3B C17-methyltransferase
MGSEEDRCRKAIYLAREGKKVALVSSGDTGIYGMAGLVLEILAQEGLTVDLEIVPGVPAAVTAAARLGAPLMLDYATISLSDLLIPWEVIEKRLIAAASSDLVMVIYNPKSQGRTWQLCRAREIILEYRPPDTPVGVVTDAGREGEKIVITDLAGLLDQEITMRSIAIIGNSTTYRYQDWLITPRGYNLIA